MHLLMLYSQFIPPLPSFGNHKFIFYACESVSVLGIKCPVLKKNNGDVCNNILMFNLQIGFLHLCAFLNSQYINFTHKNMHFYQVY